MEFVPLSNKCCDTHDGRSQYRLDFGRDSLQARLALPCRRRFRRRRLCFEAGRLMQGQISFTGTRQMRLIAKARAETTSDFVHPSTAGVERWCVLLEAPKTSHPPKATKAASAPAGPP